VISAWIPNILTEVFFSSSRRMQTQYRNWDPVIGQSVIRVTEELNELKINE
jgi:hypothetical protein